MKNHMQSPKLVISPTPIHFEAGKWIKIQVLLDSSEMGLLLDELGDFWIFLTSIIVQPGEETTSKESFLACYEKYVSSLKQGVIPPIENYRTLFSTAWSMAVEDHLYAMNVGDGKRVVRTCNPIIQLRNHCMDYSTFDHKFREMVFGQDSINWGIQFSYPQIYEDPITGEIGKVGSQFPNTQLFQNLRQWMREHTVPTPFIVDEKQVNIPMRLGKGCFSWINKHPQLIKKNLRVKE
jgi:hypothetical protein